ncbi:MAG: outer membrane beta-barrel protein [Acidobacteria bacterium]|nr:outer membrane beta-barrel protein [Acidobacteriota bacterium]
MRKASLLLGMVLLVSLTAAAQDYPKADAFLGYSYVRANPATSGAPGFNLNGGSASIAYNPSESFGIVADFGGYHVGQIAGTSVDANLYTYLFGPRLSYRKHEWVTPFAQVLFGGAHASSGALGTGSANAFAMAAGGGVDIKVSQHVAVRAGQVEYLMTRFQESTPNRQTQNNLRFSTGILFRFGR